MINGFRLPTQATWVALGLVIWLTPSEASPSGPSPTFNRDVAPILYKRCTSCHRPGEVAPFALISYADAAKRASLIADVTAKRFMPPWKPEPGPVPFRDDQRLTSAEIEILKEWSAAGAPEGDSASRPEPPQYTPGWQLGQPDQVYSLPMTNQIPADGPDIYRCMVLPVEQTEDRYVSSWEFRPESRRVVHHAFLYVDTTGAARRLDAATPEPGYLCPGGPGFVPSTTVGVWVPGWPMPALPPGFAGAIPKGSDLVVQIHYHPSGRPEADRSSLGLKFTSKPRAEVQGLFLNSRNLNIPPGDPKHLEVASSTLPVDVDLIYIMPHAHYLGKDLLIEAHLPDGSNLCLIHVPDWDFKWQGFYHYERPIRLPRGTRIDLRYVYDNSDQNPRNPFHPPQLIHWGEQTTDEMELAILGVAPARPMDPVSFRRSLMLVLLQEAIRDGQNLEQFADSSDNLRLRVLLKAFDWNRNGTLDGREKTAALAFLDFASGRGWRVMKLTLVLGLIGIAAWIWLHRRKKYAK
jgi:hypothetical protein